MNRDSYLIAVRSRNQSFTGRKMALEHLHDPVSRFNGDPRSSPITQPEGRYGLNNHHCNTPCRNSWPLVRYSAHPKIGILARWKHRHLDQYNFIGLVARCVGMLGVNMLGSAPI